MPKTLTTTNDLENKMTLLLSEQDVKEKVITYFKKCSDEKALPQIADLLIVLGISRADWLDIEKHYPKIAMRARHYIEARWVDLLPYKNSSSGAIFYLRNMFSDVFRDKPESPSGNVVTVNFIKYGNNSTI